MCNIMENQELYDSLIERTRKLVPVQLKEYTMVVEKLCEIIANSHSMSTHQILHERRTYFNSPGFKFMMFPAGSINPMPSPICLVITALLVESDHEIVLFTTGRRAARKMLESIWKCLQLQPELSRRIAKYNEECIKMTKPSSSVLCIPSGASSIRGISGNTIISMIDTDLTDCNDVLARDVLLPMLQLKGVNAPMFFTEGPQLYYYNAKYKIMYNDKYGYQLRPYINDDGEDQCMSRLET